MDCRDYLSEYLAAHADNELTAGERSAVEKHLSGCSACRARLAEERSLKALVRQHAGIVKTPADARQSIRAALAEFSEPQLSERAVRGSFAGVAARRDNAGTAGRERPHFKRSRMWTSLAVAASAVVFVALIVGREKFPTRAAGRPGVTAFDLAIKKYVTFDRAFEPNVPREAFSDRYGSYYAWVLDGNSVKQVSDNAVGVEVGDIERAYRDADMPDDLFDFEPSGYGLIGGRLDRQSDGRLAAYTLYRGYQGSILNICYRDARMAAPVGAISWVGMHSFYNYKGYSICLTFYPTGHFVSILVTRGPLQQLIWAVTLAEMTVAQK